MLCVHDNWARHNQPEKYPALYQHFHTDISIFHGPAVKTAYERHNNTPFTFKTTLQGEEYYHFDNIGARVGFGQYLLLNGGQSYFCEVEFPEQVQSLAVFFGTRVVHNVLACLKEKDEVLLDNIGFWNDQPIYFFEKLYNFSPALFQLRTALVQQLTTQQHNQLVLEELAYEFLSQLLLQHNLEKTAVEKIKARKASTQKECYRRICYAVDYLHSNYQQAIHLQSLAAAVRLSPTHLSKLFREFFSTGPYQYLKNIRLEKACHLLKNTSLDVDDIVMLIGYEDSSAFIRSFKNKYHITPSAFRQK